jgi:hypothetical protein
MAKYQQKRKDSDGGAAVQSIYTPPSLKEFGLVGTLTCAGSGADPERGAMAMMTDRQRP